MVMVTVVVIMMVADGNGDDLVAWYAEVMVTVRGEGDDRGGGADDDGRDCDSDSNDNSLIEMVVVLRCWRMDRYR